MSTCKYSEIFVQKNHSMQNDEAFKLILSNVQTYWNATLSKRNFSIKKLLVLPFAFQAMDMDIVYTLYVSFSAVFLKLMPIVGSISFASPIPNVMIKTGLSCLFSGSHNELQSDLQLTGYRRWRRKKCVLFCVQLFWTSRYNDIVFKPHINNNYSQQQQFWAHSSLCCLFVCYILPFVWTPFQFFFSFRYIKKVNWNG